VTTRVLIYALNYAPEVVGAGKYTAELAEWLAVNGFSPRVICAPPYYPDWKVANPYKGWRYRRETMNGVDLWRCPLWVPRKPSGATRILHLLSFAISSFWPLMRSLSWKPECLILMLPTLTSAPGAIVFKQVANCPAWIHIQDFELGAAIGLGLTDRGPMFRFLGRLERWFYRQFDLVSSISLRMSNRLKAMGISPDKVRLIPNWVDCALIGDDRRTGGLRQELGIQDGCFMALYAGTLNLKQGVEFIVETARILQDRPNLRFVICGAGPESRRLKNLANGLDNILWMDPLPTDRFPELLNAADMHLLTQLPGAADMVLPSKLGGILASGRPVIAAVGEGTEIAEILSGRGIVVPASDPGAIAGAVVELMDSPIVAGRLGEEGRRYAENTLDKQIVLPQFHHELLHLIISKQGTGL
jgi:colanic acid biosynthesis glycosyl transferase WcaI